MPPDRSLSEAAKSHMDDFLDNIYLVLPALRFDFFTKNSPAKKESIEGVDTIRFELKIKKNNIHAFARLQDGQFIVEKDSKARKSWVGTTSGDSTYTQLFNALVKQGVLEERDNHRVYTRDYKFNSTSAAAAVTAGRPTSGPAHWINVNSQESYAEWEIGYLKQENQDR